MRGLVVDVPDEEPTVLVAYEFRSTPTDLVQLQHLASAMAVLLAQQNVRREHDRRIGAEVMAQLCDGRMRAAEAEAQLAERGLRVDDSSIVAAGTASTAGERQLHLSLGRRGMPHLLLRRGDLLYALMPVNDASLAALRHRLGRDTTLGISDPLAQPARAPAALREATWAVRVAESASDRVARYADATMLSVLRNTEEAQVVVDRVLGELIAYDVAHSSDMVSTLDSFSLDHLSDLGRHVGVPADQALAVDHAETAEAAHLDGELHRHKGVGRMGDDGNLEPVCVELPRRRHIL